MYRSQPDGTSVDSEIAQTCANQGRGVKKLRYSKDIFRQIVDFSLKRKQKTFSGSGSPASGSVGQQQVSGGPSQAFSSTTSRRSPVSPNQASGGELARGEEKFEVYSNF